MKLFLSYAVEDQESAKLIAFTLRSAGHEVWFEVDGIAGGKNWQQETRSVIQDSDWFIVLVSPDYIESAAARWQLLTALELQKAILPAVIRSTPFAILSHIRHLDLSDNLQDGLPQLVNFLAEEAKPTRAEHMSGQLKQLAEMFSKVSTRIEKGQTPDRIFIAYSRKQRPIAEALYNLLIRNNKAVFWDAKIKAGVTWRQTIQKALDDATHLIVIWTADAALSNEVEREVSYALAKHKTIIPILSKEIPELPYHLYGLHYLILPDDLKALEQDLIDAIDQSSTDDDLFS